MSLRKIMLRIVTGSIAVACLLAVSGSYAIAAKKQYFLVQDGKTKSVIVAPKKSSDAVQQAIDELQYHIKRAAGVSLKVVNKEEEKSIPLDWVRVIFKQNKELPVETFQVQTKGNTLVFTGDGGVADTLSADTLSWAVDHYLDEQLGVLWLWPGDTGTYVPERKNIPLPSINTTQRPALESRRLRTHLLRTSHMKGRRYESPIMLLSEGQFQKQLKDARTWKRRFQVGSAQTSSRVTKAPGSFLNWWEKYGDDHPEYFAVPPEGSIYKQPWPRPTFVKLNLSNTKVDDQIIANWKAAGAPDYWKVTPTDGVGFDTSAGTRAMDDPPNQDPMEMWKWGATANLTARYVKFWNRLITKMRKINPNIHLVSLAYSNYEKAPLNGLKLEPNIELGLVVGYGESARQNWEDWYDAGTTGIKLRPNWWYEGGIAPALPLHEQGNFFKFAQSHNMIGFDSDSLQGNWGTQGPLYYVIARLMVHPEMSVDEIIDEYCSAFGNAAPNIKEYLSYWEQFTERAGYPRSRGGETKLVHPKLVKMTVEKYNLSTGQGQAWEVLPYLYTDEVLNKAYAILDKADEDTKSDNDYVKARIQFFRDGLNHLKLTRDVVKFGLIKKRTPEQQHQYYSLSVKLQEMRKELTPKYVIWGEALDADEVRWNAPTNIKMIAKTDIAEDYIKSQYHEARSFPLKEGWLFSTDANDDGMDRGVLKADFDDSSWAPTSPFSQWQLQGFSDYHGVAWYRTQFQGKQLVQGETASLYFGAIDGNAVVYLNGKKIKEHTLGSDYKGWDEAFTAEIADQMKSGENTLVVKVTSKSKDTASGIFGGVALVVGKHK